MTRPQEPMDLMDATLRARAVAAARGAEAFDLLITGGTVVDMVTGEQRAADVGIVGSLIASVHAPAAAMLLKSSTLPAPSCRRD